MDQEITVPTLTINQALARLRAVGLKTSPQKLADGIECGIYPFGVCIRNGKGRRWFQLYAADMERWIAQHGIEKPPTI